MIGQHCERVLFVRNESPLFPYQFTSQVRHVAGSARWQRMSLYPSLERGLNVLSCYRAFF